jgi:hypothetical protein
VISVDFATLINISTSPTRAMTVSRNHPNLIGHTLQAEMTKGVPTSSHRPNDIYPDSQWKGSDQREFFLMSEANAVSSIHVDTGAQVTWAPRPLRCHAVAHLEAQYQVVDQGPFIASKVRFASVIFSTKPAKWSVVLKVYIAERMLLQHMAIERVV